MASYCGFSWDFDGCLSSEEADDILALPANVLWIEHINESKGRYDGIEVFINSNRQSVRDDNSNAKKNGSCYPVMQALSRKIGAKFHPILMTDVYNDLQDGETFQQALSLLDQNQKDYVQERARVAQPPDWLHDTSKLSTFLMQVHKMASEHPNDKFDFYFFDDRKDILDGLATFFAVKENRKLLPHNLQKLHIVPFPQQRIKRDNSMQVPVDDLKNKEKEGELLAVIEKEEEQTDDYISYAPIAGEGEIRFDYRDMIKEMAAVCIESKKFQESDPADKDANPVKNYNQAKNGGFVLSVEMNFARDYVFGKKPVTIPAPTDQLRKLPSVSLTTEMEAQEKLITQAAPPSPAAASSKRGLLSSIFHPFRKEEKEEKKQEKGKEREKGKSKKEKGSLQQKLNKDLHEKFSSREKKKEKEKEKELEKEEELQALPSGMGSIINQAPRAAVPKGSFFSDSRVRHPDAPPTSPSILSNHRAGI
jgi:Skp family chaperone for outer membrane proteins